MEGPDELIDWGVRSASAIDKNATTLELISDILGRYQPKIIVLQDCRQGKWRRCERVGDLLWEVSRLALREHISTRLISRARLKNMFATLGAHTKHEIATVIAKRLPELAPRQPRYRRPLDAGGLQHGNFRCGCDRAYVLFRKREEGKTLSVKRNTTEDVRNTKEQGF